MYLTALITKWRSKHIQFVLDFPSEGQVQLTAHILDQQRYCMAISDDLEYLCKVVDLGLTRRMEEAKTEEAKVDNDHANS